MIKRLLPFLFRKSEPEEELFFWPDGAQTVKVRVLNPIVVRTLERRRGPYTMMGAGVYTLKYDKGVYKVAGTKRFLDETQWKARMENGLVVVLG